MILFTLFIYFITIVPLTTLIHELGHLFVAQMLAIKNLRLSIGTGPVIKRIKFQQVQLTLHLFFFIGGYTTTEETGELQKWKKVCIALGGPLLNGMVVLGLFLPGFGSGSSFITIWFQWFALYNLWVCVVNIIPFKRKQRCSDGYVIYQTVSGK